VNEADKCYFAVAFVSRSRKESSRNCSPFLGHVTLLSYAKSYSGDLEGSGTVSKIGSNALGSKLTLQFSGGWGGGDSCFISLCNICC
jgi:hypothetical protein